MKLVTIRTAGEGRIVTVNENGHLIMLQCGSTGGLGWANLTKTQAKILAEALLAVADTLPD